MASLLEENRLRLQQRISQRLKGGVHAMHSRTELPHRFIAQRRRPENSDPFRLQAQEYIYNNKSLADKYDISHILRQVRKEQGDMMQLPMLRPRYTDLHPNKGVPTQKYIDMILDRKGPMHRAPSRRIKVGRFTGKEYDDSISIKSYRNIDPVEAQSYQNVSSEEDESSAGKIVLVAPHRIQYKSQHNLRNSEVERRNSPPRRRKGEGITALKGKKLSTASSSLEECTTTTQTRAPRNLSFLHKLRKRLGSRDRRFVDNIASQTFLTENTEKSSLMVFPANNDNSPTKRVDPLPPIRITVTNPLPENITSRTPIHSDAAGDANEQQTHEQRQFYEERQKRMPHVKFSLPKKRKTKKKARRRRQDSPTDEDGNNETLLKENSGDENGFNDQVESEHHDEKSADRRLSHTDSLMPAPITKITFQSCNEANLRKPKKVVTNVHVERVIQKNVVATHPEFFHHKEPAVKVATFEMTDNPNPDLVFRKDGTFGPAPPSTNYVNFQKTTRQGGQSRLLLSLRNRVLAAEAANNLVDWSPRSLIGIHSSDQELLKDTSNPPKHFEGIASHRKLGRIRAMKRSLMDAHKALFEETNSKIEVDAMTDDVRSEKSFATDFNASSVRKSYYINRLPDILPPQHQTKVLRYHKEKPDEGPAPETDSASTRSIGTQWTTDKITDPSATPQAPPNTAFLRKIRRE